MSAFGIGPTELIVILIIALVVLGPGRLPEVGRTIGKAMREFKKASTELTTEVSKALEETPDRKTESDLQTLPEEKGKLTT